MPRYKVTYRFHKDPAVLRAAFLGEVVLEDHVMFTDVDPLAENDDASISETDRLANTPIDLAIAEHAGCTTEDLLDFEWELALEEDHK